MSYRFMRILLFFDLPMIERKELKEYRKFRKFLLKNGFIMLQKSVYSRMLLNSVSAKNFTEKIRKNIPKKGLIQVITITEKQYQKMDTIVGEYNSNLLDTDERLEIF